MLFVIEHSVFFCNLCLRFGILNARIGFYPKFQTARATRGVVVHREPHPSLAWPSGFLRFSLGFPRNSIGFLRFSYECLRFSYAFLVARPTQQTDSWILTCIAFQGSHLLEISVLAL